LYGDLSRPSDACGKMIGGGSVALQNASLIFISFAQFNFQQFERNKVKMSLLVLENSSGCYTFIAEPNTFSSKNALLHPNKQPANYQRQLEELKSRLLGSYKQRKRQHKDKQRNT
jgi:hypothetical protein